MLNSLLIAALCVVWGATWVAIKIGLSDSPPFYGAGLRFLIASAILGVWVWRMRKPWPERTAPWGWIVVAGLLMFFGSYATVYYVEQYINAALAAILFASFPFFVAVGAHFYLDNERLTPVKTLGLVIGFSGVIVVFGGGTTAPATSRWWAPALMLSSPIASAIVSIVIKKHLTRHDPFVLNFIQMSLGTLVLLPVAALVEDIGDFHWTQSAVGALLFLSLFGSVFTFVTYYYLLRIMEASRLSLIAFVTPIVATLLGWIVLDEKLTPATLVGATLVLAGIWIVNVIGARPGVSQKSYPQLK